MECGGDEEVLHLALASVAGRQVGGDIPNDSTICYRNVAHARSKGLIRVLLAVEVGGHSGIGRLALAARDHRGNIGAGGEAKGNAAEGHDADDDRPFNAVLEGRTGAPIETLAKRRKDDQPPPGSAQLSRV
jgi:hypothetical protein